MAEDRVFVRARRHYRKRYSTTEARIGALILGGLLAIGAWVAYRGGQPDPELLRDPALLEKRPSSSADRGPLPTELAPAGWTERGLATFDPTNVYVKIDGREGYYKSFGFQRLHCATLAAAAGEPIVDLELYDLGSSQNALGAAAGEVPEGATPEVVGGGTVLLHRNALYLARGRYYLRAIGSSEDEAVQAALRHVRDRFLASLPAEALPWTHTLFTGLGVAPAKISYLAENAFSFGFAPGVHVGTLPDGDTDLFVTVQGTEAEAAALAKQFRAGFLEYGSEKGTEGGATWIEDRYLARVSAVTSVGRLVVGVKSAADPKVGAELLERLARAVKALPADTKLDAPKAPAKTEAE